MAKRERPGPTCVKCLQAMSLHKRFPVDAGHGLSYELRTFRCDECGRDQTYTAGKMEAPLGELQSEKRRLFHSGLP